MAELTSADRSVDVRYVNGTRLVLGMAALEAIAPWAPGSEDVVAITGGTRGIGRALGLQLAEAGAEVLLIGRSRPADALDQARITWVEANVTDRGALSAVLGGLRVTGWSSAAPRPRRARCDAARPEPLSRRDPTQLVGALPHTTDDRGVSPTLGLRVVGGAWAVRRPD